MTSPAPNTPHTAPEAPPPHPNSVAGQQRKITVLVALAVLIIILGWVATLRWTYGTENVSAKSLFQRINQEVAPEVKDMTQETRDTLNAQ